MKIFHNCKLVVILICFILSVVPCAQCADRFVNVGTYDFPPFLELKNGEPGGIWLDILEKILDRCGIRYSVKEYPAKRAVINIVTGNIDIIMAAKGISAFENNAVYSRSVLTNVEVSVYTRKDTPVPKDREELRNKTVLVMRGYSYGGFIKYFEQPENNIILDHSNNHESLFRKLKAKRVDYAVTYTDVASNVLKEFNIDEIQSNPMTNFDVFFIVSKKTPDYQKLMDDMEKAFNELKNEGKL